MLTGGIILMQLYALSSLSDAVRPDW